MEFGIVSYGLSSGEVKRTPSETVTKAKELGFDRVQLDVSGLRPSEGMGVLERARKLRKVADEVGIAVEIGATTGLAEAAREGRADLYFEIAQVFANRVIKACLAGCLVRFKEKWDRAAAERQVEEKICDLRAVEEVARKFGIRVAFENHIDFTSDELARIMGAVESDYVGFCWDTANQLFFGEDPVEACRRFASRIHTTHFKDYLAIPSENGAFLNSAVPGEGVIDMPAIVQILLSEDRDIPVNLEIIAHHQRFECPYKSAEFYEHTFSGQDTELPGLRLIEAGGKRDTPVPPDMDSPGFDDFRCDMLRGGLAALKSLLAAQA